MVWKYYLRDEFWVWLAVDDHDDVIVDIKDEDEEMLTLYLDPKEAYLIGKKMMELGEAP